MQIPWRRSVYAPTGSARWWWRALSDLAWTLVFAGTLVALLVSGRVTGLLFWLCLAGAVYMVLPVGIKVAVCVAALRERGSTGSV